VVAEVQDRQGFPSDAAIRDAHDLVVETDNLRVKVSLLGGRLISYELKNYRQDIAPHTPPLNLVDHVEGAPLPLGVYSGDVSDAWTNYRIVSGADPINNLGESNVSVSTGDQRVIELEGTLPDGRSVRKSLTFYGDGFFVDVKVGLSAPPADSSRLEVAWTKLIASDSPSLLDPYKISGYVWFDGTKAHSEPFSKLTLDDRGRREFGQVQWLTLADKYFMATLISPHGPTRGRGIKIGQLFSTRLTGDEKFGEFRLFAGPKSYNLLEQVGYELRRNIDFGWTGFVAAPLLSLLHMFFGLFGNYGVAIVALTILVRFVLYPLNATSFKQMKAMQDIQPDVKRLREQITDKQQQQIELMALYKKRGVNPLGGCFPILLQMPIFIGLYSALLLAIELRHAPFAFWINDLSSREHLYLFGISIPVMVILMVISMLLQQWLTPHAGDPVQKKVMMAMPFIFGFMFAGMPAGLTLYWLTSNILAIAQQKMMQSAEPKYALHVTGATSIALLVFAILLAALGT
jgi:YidC/Oxa1 family membrane protein insertase